MENIKAIFDGLPPAVILLIGMAVLASLDFVSSVFGHIRDGDFQLALLSKWALDKGMPIVSVALLFIVDQAVSILQLPIDGFDVGIFGMMATAQAGTFILTEAGSIQKNLAAKSETDPVLVEDGGTDPVVVDETGPTPE